MGSKLFKEFLDKKMWMKLSPTDHIFSKHYYISLEALLKRARHEGVNAATKFTCTKTVMVKAICVAVELHRDEIERYCYSFSHDVIEPEYLVIEQDIFGTRRTDGVRVPYILGGGYLRYEARKGIENYIPSSRIRVIIQRLPGSGTPRFKVINAFPCID